MKTKHIVGIATRIIVGLVFVLSAVTKYLSIGAVDIFVYEHGIFSWAFTTFATRTLIIFEAFIGVMLLSGLHPKKSKWAAIVMLVLFTIYVLLKQFMFKQVGNDNCHCFGTIFLLNDTQTIIKNIILLAISYFMFWDKGITSKSNSKIAKFMYSQQNYLAIVTCAVIFIAVMTLRMPEPLESKIRPKHISLDMKKFELLINNDSVQNLGVTEGKKIVCLYSTGCKYCKRAAMRLDVVRQRYDINDTNFAIIFWGSEPKIDSFFVNTKTKVLPHTLVDPRLFLPATKGVQPVILLMNNGKIESSLKYPNISESRIKNFMEK